MGYTTNFVTIQVEPETRDDLKNTAARVAKKMGLTRLSLKQLVQIMHEEYKKSL